MSLEATIKEIKTLKPLAEENVESGPIETAAGRRGRKNQAIERIRLLKDSYINELLRSAIFIVVSGDGREEFEKIASGEKFNLFSADPEEFYKDLSKRVAPAIYTSRTDVSNLFDILGRHLEDKMNELGASEYNQLIFKEKYVQPAKTTEEFTSIVKQAINEQVGAEIIGIQAVNSIVDKAIESGHSAKTTSIVLSTNDQNLVQYMLSDLQKRGNKVFLVLAGSSDKNLRGLEDAAVGEVTEESVKKTLNSIKKSLKGKE